MDVILESASAAGDLFFGGGQAENVMPQGLTVWGTARQIAAQTGSTTKAVRSKIQRLMRKHNFNSVEELIANHPDFTGIGITPDSSMDLVTSLRKAMTCLIYDNKKQCLQILMDVLEEVEE